MQQTCRIRPLTRRRLWLPTDSPALDRQVIEIGTPHPPTVGMLYQGVLPQERVSLSQEPRNTAPVLSVTISVVAGSVDALTDRAAMSVHIVEHNYSLSYPIVHYYSGFSICVLNNHVCFTTDRFQAPTTHSKGTPFVEPLWVVPPLS